MRTRKEECLLKNSPWPKGPGSVGSQGWAIKDSLQQENPESLPKYLPHKLFPKIFLRFLIH